jgi:adenosylmethionine-8-amino-7-oxononanoate aminotransferase
LCSAPTPLSCVNLQYCILPYRHRYFASTRYGVVPDIITCGKGMTSGYFPMGAMIANEKLYEPFRYGTTSFLHGFTFGGHPAGAAIALANLDIFEREGINEHVRSLEVKR